MRFERVLVLGLGQIGGSLVKALRRGGFAREILGWDGERRILGEALEQGWIDAALDPLSPPQNLDLALLALPPGVAEQHLHRVAKARLITDVLSVKSPVVAAARHALGPAMARFVPAHPIAGTEKAGWVASRADLFVGRPVVLTPLPITDADALAAVRQLWQLLGAQVFELALEAHDPLFALSSHLPHVLAFALAQVVQHQAPSAQLLRLLRPQSLVDMTRVAASSPQLWQAISASNHEALLPAVEAVLAELEHFRQQLATGSVPLAWWQAGHQARLALFEPPADAESAP